MDLATPQRIRVLLVDDHGVVRLGLRTLLEQCRDVEVVGEASTVAGAVEEAARLKPDVVLMDIRMPDGSGFTACRQIRQENADVRVLFLTSFTDEKVVMESIDAGGDGYLLKEVDEETLVRGIRSVASGQSVLDPAVTRRVLERVKNPELSAAHPVLETLSPQEHRVLALVADGKTNKEIGVALGLSEKTVKNYLSNTLDKLGLARRSQAAAFFVQHTKD